jgi:uncharacterized protein (DUF4415 family)
MNAPSKTDWERVKREAAADAPIAFDPAIEPYDPNDAAAVQAFTARATVRRGAQKSPTKTQVALRLDADLLEALRATGDGWQTRINDMLRAFMRLSGQLR